MNRMSVLLRREILSQFLSPTSWVLLTLVWLVHGILFRWVIIPATTGDIMYMTWRSAGMALWVQLFLVPLQTMRLISEEKRSGTFEMLVTTPARDHEIVLAKFIGALLFNAIVWLIIPAHTLIISLSGGSPSMGPVWCSYLAVVATGGLYIAIGLVASAVTRHQILAAFLTVVLLILVGVAPMLWSVIPESWPTLRAVIRSGDLNLQLEEASRGLLDLVHLTYKFAFGALFLLYTTRILEARKWA